MKETTQNSIDAAGALPAFEFRVYADLFSSSESRDCELRQAVELMQQRELEEFGIEISWELAKQRFFFEIVQKGLHHLQEQLENLENRTGALENE